MPNPSFEDYTQCPITNGWIWVTEPWTAVYGGVSYYHECGSNGFGVPVNEAGWQYARTGKAYIGCSMWAYPSTYEGQFPGVSLASELITGKKYKVELYVSLLDSVWYSVKNIGVYFSQSQPPSNINTLLNYEPQVQYTGAEYLYNKEGWTKIEGSFYADGGEQFMTIGNFDGHNNSDTAFVPGGGIPPLNAPGYYKIAGYYIDDVSVTLDTTTGVNEIEQTTFEVYPNPAKEKITIETADHRPQTIVKLFDITGREVLITSLTASRTTIDVSGFAGGIYTAVLLEDGVAVGRRKIIVE